MREVSGFRGWDYVFGEGGIGGFFGRLGGSFFFYCLVEVIVFMGIRRKGFLVLFFLFIRDLVELGRFF